jgi:antitoxin ParD1/3/4
MQGGRTGQGYEYQRPLLFVIGRRLPHSLTDAGVLVNVSLTPELERFVIAKVKSGLYGSSSEVIRASLRLLQQWEKGQAARLEGLRRNVGVGIDQADRGKVLDGDEVFDELLKGRSAKRTVGGPAKHAAPRQRNAVI